MQYILNNACPPLFSLSDLKSPTPFQPILMTFFFFFSNQVQFVFPDTLRNQPFSGMVTLPGAKIPNNNSKTQEQQQKSISFLPATIKQH